MGWSLALTRFFKKAFGFRHYATFFRFFLTPQLVRVLFLSIFFRFPLETLGKIVQIEHILCLFGKTLAKILANDFRKMQDFQES